MTLPFVTEQEKGAAVAFLHTVRERVYSFEQNHSVAFLLGFDAAIKALETGE